MNWKTPLLLVLCLPLMDRVHGCSWDRDTLAMEARGLPSVLEVAVGRFERWPDLYYQMRIDRLQPLLATTDDLSLFDDVGVALDRIGRSGEAIEVMAAKWDRLEPRLDDPAYRDHHYRYLANLGTFHAHHWLRAGADLNQAGDLERAETLLQQALEINPDAHFGRERFQLGLISQILLCRDPLVLKFTKPFAWLGDRPDEEAVEGLRGLIVLGEAWGSYDVFRALVHALVWEDMNHLAYFVWLRCEELKNEGKKSFFNRPSEMPWEISEIGKLAAKEYYTRAKEDTLEWRKQRDAFIMTRLQAGIHPDTHEDFWMGYQESAFPIPPDSWFPGPWYRRVWIWLSLYAVACLIPLALGFIIALITNPRTFWRTTGRQGPAGFILSLMAGAFVVASIMVLVNWIIDFQPVIAFGLLLFWPIVLYAPAARRLQDLGRPPRESYLMVVPALNYLLLLRFALQPGKRAENKFGPPVPLRWVNMLAVVLLLVVVAGFGYIGHSFAYWY